MIRTLYRNSQGNFTIDVPQAHWRVALHDPAGTFWVDFAGEPPDVVEPLLKDTFGFHQLAIEDALRQTHVPKIDNWGDYVYVALHAVDYHTDTLALTTREIDAFLGKNFLVTHHDEPLDAVNRLWTGCQRDQRHVENGPDHLLYDLLDLLTADYMPAMDKLDETIDQIEDEVFDQPTKRTLNTIFSVKRAVLHLRRIIGPQREVLNRLARDDYAMIDARDRIYFRDVYDHLVRLADLNESLRDLVGGALDTYLSVTSNRLNQIMKVLTAFTALFMPISFLAGAFGMNFVHLPFDSLPLLWITLAVMIVMPVSMILWFRRQGWW